MESSEAPKRVLASQTLFRGLDIVDAVGNGCRTLASIVEHTGIALSTAHRLASALVQVRYLEFEPRRGYRLGPRLMELGFQAYRQSDLTRIARERLEWLAELTQDTVHLARLDGVDVMYLDKVEGSRPVEVRSYVGGRKPICSTGVGKALILDEAEARWRTHYLREAEQGMLKLPLDPWLSDMRKAVLEGNTFDNGENQPRIRCVAAPIRGPAGSVVAAVSITSTVDYTNDDRLQELAPLVRGIATQISASLGRGRG
jgi:DNA-binding IclR family transcriptional regulator